MRVVTSEHDDSIDFDALGGHLEGLEGKEVRVILASVNAEFVAAWFGGIQGTAHLVTEAENDAALTEVGDYELPAGTIADGERAYLLEIGGLSLVVSSEDYQGARELDGDLRFQVGPIQVTIGVGGGDTDA